jgi:hypothetical protein
LAVSSTAERRVNARTRREIRRWLFVVLEPLARITIDQQPYTQGFYPVVALVLKLRYDIAPHDIDAGAEVVDRDNLQQVLELTKQGYR